MTELATLDQLVPSQRDEDWRYVDLRQFADFQPAPADPTCDPLAALATCAPELSSLATDADCILLRDGELVSEAMSPAPALESTWLQGADAQTRWLAGRLATDAQLSLRGLHQRPLLIIAATTGAVSGWRLHIDAPAGAVADIIIAHCHLAPAQTGCLIEVEAAADSALRIDELILGATPAAVGQALISRNISVAGKGSVTWASAGTGGACQRCVTTASLAGEHAECRLGGARVVAGSNQAHHLIRLAHEAPNAASRQFVKHVAGGRGRTGFDGRILVVAGADGTDAEQQNANLQLTPTARVSTRPQLDIFADEVSAAHGATVGQPDDDQIRYLRARGIDQASALSLVTDGFVAEAIDELHHPAARATARRALLAALHSD